MKTFSVAVAVAVMLAFIYLQESSAVRVTEVQELEEPMGNDQEMQVKSWKMPYNIRQKRSDADCRLCCGCCPGMNGCGICCMF